MHLQSAEHPDQVDRASNQSMASKTYKLQFNNQQREERKARPNRKNPNYQEEAFEKLASQAFLKIR